MPSRLSPYQSGPDGHGYMLMWRDAEPQPVERADTQLALIIFDTRLDFEHQIVEPVGSRLPGRADPGSLSASAARRW